MSSCESSLASASKFVSIALVTCLIGTGGIWLAQGPSSKEHAPSKLLSPAHWMFWMAGRDLDEELRNPKPIIDPERLAIPVWDSNQMSDIGRYMKEEQEKRDQLMEDIRSRWGS